MSREKTEFDPSKFGSYEELVKNAPEEAENFKPAENGEGFVKSTALDLEAAQTDAELVGEQEKNLAELQAKYHGQIGRTLDIESGFAETDVQKILGAKFGEKYGTIDNRKNVIFRNNLAFYTKAMTLVDNYPTLFSETKERYREVWDQASNALYNPRFLGMEKLYSQTTINDDGSLPILGANNELVNITQADCEISEQMFLEKARANQEIAMRVYNRRQLIDQLGKITVVIEMYKSGQKPAPRDMRDGKSIGEQRLQILYGGTPSDGQSFAVNLISQPIRYDYETVEIPEGKYEITGHFANYDLLVRGRNVSKKYHKFVSRFIKAHDKEIGVKRTLEELQAYDQQYLDAEWEHREEAITLAEEIKSILEDLIAYCEGLAQQIQEKA